MNSFQFGYDKFLCINNPQIILISQKLFMPQKNETSGKNCNFCNGESTEYIIVKKALDDLPAKLIVIIDYEKINNFVLQANLLIQNNNNQVIYILNKFIEFNTNILYKINETNTQLCQKFVNNEFTTPEKLENKQPIVLFYNLIKNPININIPNNIRNQQNINNVNAFSQNNNIFNANSQQNMQQVQNMDNQSNIQLNINPQLLNQNNMQLMNNQGFSQQNTNIQNFNGKNPMNNNEFQNNMNNNGMQNNQCINMNNNIQMVMNNMGINNHMNSFNNNNININQNVINNNMINNNLTNNNIMNNNTNNNGFFNNINNMNNVSNNNMNINNNCNMNIAQNNMFNNNAMNIINNNNNLMNNMNINFQQNFILNNNQNKGEDLPPEKDPNTIFVSFTFKSNNKQIFIDIYPSETFGNAIKALEIKYKMTMQSTSKYFFKKKEITKKDFGKTLNQLHIVDSSDISIFEYK